MRHILTAGAIAAGLALIAAPAFAVPAITTSDTGFSAGPGTDYGPAPILKLGTHVDVIWCGTHKNWCLVDIHNKRGWIPLVALNFKLPKVPTFNDDGTPDSNNPVDTGPSGPAGPSGPNKSAVLVTEVGHGNPPPPMTINNLKVIKVP